MLARIGPWLEEPRAAREPDLLAPDTPEAAPAPSAVQQHHVRVDVRRLDQIMDLVGELVLARNQLQRTIAPAASPLGAAVQRVDHVTTRLQDEVMRARMQPVSALWALLPIAASQHWHLRAIGYGAVLGTMGAGAVLGALVMDRLRTTYSANALLVLAALTDAAGLLAAAYLPLAAGVRSLSTCRYKRQCACRWRSGRLFATDRGNRD